MAAKKVAGRYVVRYAHQKYAFAWFNSIDDAKGFVDMIEAEEDGVKYEIEDEQGAGR